jgi:hypothetical protein
MQTKESIIAAIDELSKENPEQHLELLKTITEQYFSICQSTITGRENILNHFRTAPLKRVAVSILKDEDDLIDDVKEQIKYDLKYDSYFRDELKDEIKEDSWFIDDCIEQAENKLREDGWLEPGEGVNNSSDQYRMGELDGFINKALNMPHKEFNILMSQLKNI